MTRYSVVSYLERFVGSGSRNASNIALFVIGTMAIGVMGSALFGLLTIWVGDTSGALVLLFVLSLLFLIIAAIGASLVIDRWRRGKAPEREDSDFQPYRGLILLVSTGIHNSNESAIARHSQGNGSTRLECCWLIYSPQSEIEANDLVRRHRGDLRTVQPERIADAYSIKRSFFAVRASIDKALGEGLRLDEAIVDITGGTKMMTAGAVLACAERGVAIQYLRAHDMSGNPTISPPIPVRVILSDELDRAGAEEHVTSNAGNDVTE